MSRGDSPNIESSSNSVSSALEFVTFALSPVLRLPNLSLEKKNLSTQNLELELRSTSRSVTSEPFKESQRRKERF